MAKRKNKLKNKPNATLHMMAWGCVSGTILAFLLFAMVSAWLGADMSHSFGDLLIFLTAIFVGGIPSMLLGFIEGFIIKRLTHDVGIHFTIEAMRDLRRAVYSYTAVITGGVGFGALLFIFGIFTEQCAAYFDGIEFVLLVAALVGAIVATFAGHRFLVRLQLWSEKAFAISEEDSLQD